MGNLSENNLVEKSKSLVWAKFRDYTAGELRLLEVYLSRINPREPSSSDVTFSLAEYCKLLGLKLNSKNLKAQLKHFLGNVVSVPLSQDHTEYELYTLFTRAEVRFDKETMTYNISISCNPELKQVFFDIAATGYIKYRLRYTVGMKQQASILLYSIVRDWMYRGMDSNEIGIKELREHLGANDPSYSDFRALRRRILEPAVNEISEVSDVVVDFEKVCVGRKTVAVRFNFHEKPHADDTDNFQPLGDDPATLLEVISPARRSGKRIYADVDWKTIAPELENAQCLAIAKLVEKKLKVEYPTLRPEKEKDAVLNIISNAYQMVLGNRTDVENPCGYLAGAIKNNELGEYATFGVDYMQ